MGANVRSAREGALMIIRPLDKDDYGYALFSFRESAKKAPGLDRVPWSFFKATVVSEFEKILDDPKNAVLGGYVDGELAGWLAMTPGKRVHTVHWCYTKHKRRREGVMTTLIESACLNRRLIYTLHARRDRATLSDGSVTKSLDESLVAALREKGVTATYVSLKEWLK